MLLMRPYSSLSVPGLGSMVGSMVAAIALFSRQKASKTSIAYMEYVASHP